MVNQKNLAIARIMLVSFCACSSGFCMRPAILAAVCAQLPKRTRVSAKCGSVCIGTCPAMS